MVNDELYHYGILGMKWGVRRTPTQLGHRVKMKSKNQNLETPKTKKTTTSSKGTSGKSTTHEKSVKEMSDDELNKLVRRLQLEKQYRDLNPKTVSKGKQFVDTVVNKTVVPAVTDAGRTLLKEYIIKKGNEALGLKAAAQKDK